jgi:tRNA (guanine37-N1)-methyltransferase
MANMLSTKENLILLCGHYKGVDQRVVDHLTTREISIGDYVLTGGELAAAVITDCIVRLIPGVLSDETSALTDSYQDGMLAPPVYTRPASYKGWKVPEVLLSGNAAEIEKWKWKESMRRTKSLRPDLYDKLQ